ncbi:hypothetical protein [Flavobacterium terrigena]|uniref:Uncharacterized protein n=1 Tax=Flavobacterium terrigena TaxID=402734 RepID=A0A1H6RYP9_9FLAO|nr:hypothetical protein [Flavobacterium terrigena]SEI56312.1 hypothetical protein SAMN05660918_0949 [Flavobacterium terrigena]
MKNYIIWLLVLFSNVLLAQNKSNLVFEDGIYSVEIQIENGKDYLKLDKENKFQIVTKNIDPVNLMCSGRNLKRGELSTDKNITNWSLTIIKEGLKDEKYSLSISFRGKKGKLFTHQFLIPVKQN